MDSLNKLAELRAQLQKKKQQLDEFHTNQPSPLDPVSEGEKVARMVDKNLLDRYSGAFYTPKSARHPDSVYLDNFLDDPQQGTDIPGTKEVMSAEGVTDPKVQSENYSEIAKALNDLRASRLKKMGGIE